jgi:hypothetical protein
MKVRWVVLDGLALMGSCAAAMPILPVQEQRLKNAQVLSIWPMKIGGLLMQ